MNSNTTPFATAFLRRHSYTDLFDLDDSLEYHNAREASSSSFSLPPDDAKLWTCVRALLNSPVYVCLTFSLASLYFTVTGVQYWGTAYMTLVLHGNPGVASSLFIGVAATGPVMGVFCGGWAVDKLGGYRGFDCRNKTMKVRSKKPRLGLRMLSVERV